MGVTPESTLQLISSVERHVDRIDLRLAVLENKRDADMTEVALLRQEVGGLTEAFKSFRTALYLVGASIITTAITLILISPK